MKKDRGYGTISEPKSRNDTFWQQMDIRDRGRKSLPPNQTVGKYDTLEGLDSLNGRCGESLHCESSLY